MCKPFRSKKNISHMYHSSTLLKFKMNTILWTIIIIHFEKSKEKQKKTLNKINERNLDEKNSKGSEIIYILFYEFLSFTFKEKKKKRYDPFFF